MIKTMEDYSLNMERNREVIKALRKQVAELEAEKPSIENGTNRYGVDVSYFRNVINRELNRSLKDFTPDELARVFARLSVTADPLVIHEQEFQAKALKEQGND